MSYYVCGRYQEALYNYKSLLEYYDKVNDSGMRAHLLNDMVMIYDSKGEDDQAMQLYTRMHLSICMAVD
jgi:tetratricopeptide (TPR) repeat protein